MRVYHLCLQKYGYIIPLVTRPDVRKYWTRNTARATYKNGMLEVTIDRSRARYKKNTWEGTVAIRWKI